VIRCEWAGATDPVMIRYHDEEWGVPCRDDRQLFERLMLEGFQAGLSWRTILHKRESFARAFEGWDPERIAAYGPDDVARLMADAGIVRNRLKVEATIRNARAYLDLGRPFSEHVWSFVDGQPIVNRPTVLGDISATTAVSDALSKDLRKRGFTFVGSTIMYAFMQSVGMVDDHVVGCFRK
jgi:DNA-3-methyladenine glycosylase I